MITTPNQSGEPGEVQVSIGGWWWGGIVGVAIWVIGTFVLLRVSPQSVPLRSKDTDPFPSPEV